MVVYVTRYIISCMCGGVCICMYLHVYDGELNTQVYHPIPQFWDYLSVCMCVTPYMCVCICVCVSSLAPV